MNIAGGTLLVLAVGCVAAAQIVLVVLVGHVDLLGLVARQLDAAPHLGRDVSAIAALPQQRVDRLLLVPALLRGHLRQVRGRALGPTLRHKLDPDAVHAQRPVQEAARLLEALNKKSEI